MVTGVVVVAAVLVTACVLRLMAGPIDLDFLKPRFLDRIRHARRARCGSMPSDIYAEWGGLSEPMRLVLRRPACDERQETGDRHGAPRRRSPSSRAVSCAASFSRQPSWSIADPGCRHHARRRHAEARAGQVRFELRQGEFVDLLIEQLLAEHNHHSLLGQLDTVEVANARVSLRDVTSGVMWIAPNAQARLQRDDAGVAISASARFTGSTSSEPIEVRLSGTYTRDRSRVSVEAGIDGLKPSMLARAVGRRGPAARPRHCPLRTIAHRGERPGRSPHRSDGSHRRRRHHHAAGVLAAPHKVRSVHALAHVDAASHTARIDHIDVDLDGPKISVTGTGLRTEQGQTFTGRAEIKQIPVDRIGDYWPLEFAPGGRDMGSWPTSAAARSMSPANSAEHTGQRPRPACRRSHRRFPRLPRHDRPLHAAHARAAERVGQGALPGRLPALRHRGGRPSASVWRAPPST